MAAIITGWIGRVGARRPRQCPDPDIEARLRELERALFDLQAWGKTRAAHTQERLERITDMVTELSDQVR